VILLALQYFFAILLALAGLHKLLHGDVFRKALAGYGLLPSRLVRPVSILLALVELVVAITLLASAALAWTAGAAALLFAMYGFAMALALWRGQGQFGCGCNWGKQQDALQGWMVVRNLAFAILLLIIATVRPANNAEMFDYLNAAFAGLALNFFYLAGPVVQRNQQLQKKLREEVWTNV